MRKHGDQLWYILQEFLFLNFFPNINFKEKFYSDKKDKFLSKALKKTLKLFLEKWMIAIALFYFSKLFQPSCEAVSNISLLKISLPTRFEGIFYSDRRGRFFQITLKKHRDSKWVSFCFLYSRTEVVWNLSAKTKQKQVVYYRYEWK